MRITLEHITFQYEKGIPVLQDIATNFDDGEFAALVGPNGSGKSTLIKCLNGILVPQKGSVTLGGRTLQDIRPRERAGMIAYVPQTEQKMVPARVFDAVLLGRKPHIHWKPGQHDLQVTSRILHDLHLEHIADRDITKLSGGQQQRVFIARALAQEPKILLLDEPTANLDLRYQMEVLELLESLARSGITIIMAIHDINTAAMYSSRILMMKEGRLFADGGPDIITEKNIRKLYGVQVQVRRDDKYIWVLPRREIPASQHSNHTNY